MHTHIKIRPATASDQAAIRRLIDQAGLNSMPFDWRCFQVAQAAEQIVGVGQIKVRRDGARELASMAVAVAWRGRGIATDIAHALLAGQSDPVYLTCRQPLQAFYSRLGFCPATQSQTPPNYWRAYRLSCFFARLLGIRLQAMVRQPLA